MRNKLWKFSDIAGRLWCGVMHDQITWPINGQYRCRKCQREYTISWNRNDVSFHTRSTVTGPIPPSNGASAQAHSVSDGPSSRHPQTAAACPA